MGHAKTKHAPGRASDPAQLSAWSETIGGIPGRPASDDPVRDLLTGEEQGRTLSWLAHIPRKAGLKSTGQVRPSTRPRAHGNFQRTWTLPEFAAGVAARLGV